MIFLPPAQPKPMPHIDQCDDAAAQIEHAGNFVRRQRNLREALRRKDVLDAQNWQAKQLTADHRGNVFVQAMVGRFTHGFHHAA